MKHKFLIITLSLLLALLCSCNQGQGQGQELKPLKPLPERITASELNEGEIETGTVAGDYIYSMDQLVLIKYHIPSGTATTVCQDPFCDHNIQCPFSVSGNAFAAMGNILYYVNVFLLFNFSSFFRTLNTLLTKSRKNRERIPTKAF